MAKELTVALIGAGSRGRTYTDIMAQMGGKFRVVAVAEPVDSRRNYIKQTHGLSEDMCFTHWKDLLDAGKLADVALICTQDRMHLEPALQAISLGYELLLEKPVSPEPAECLQVAKAAEEKPVEDGSSVSL